MRKGGGGLWVSLLPEELETLVEKSGPFRSGGRSGVGLAWVRHMHTYTCVLRYDIKRNGITILKEFIF